MAGSLTISTLKNDTGVLATQNGMTGICKAWVNFNPSGGSAVIRSSYNVSSVTYNSTGNYTVNFTTSMVDLNYTPVCCVSDDNVAQTFAGVTNTWGSSATTSRVIVYTATTSGSVNRSYVGVGIFGN